MQLDVLTRLNSHSQSENSKLLLCLHYPHYCCSTLTASPTIHQVPSDVNKLEGRSVTFSCNVTGEPQPSLQWELGAIVLENNTRLFEISETSVNGTLTVHDVGLMDAGIYSCIATNVHGTISASATLQVQGNH